MHLCAIPMCSEVERAAAARLAKSPWSAHSVNKGNSFAMPLEITCQMNITVTKSLPVLVGPTTSPPAAPTTEHISLTSFDKALAFFPVTSFHIFNHAIHESAETVKRALSHALVHYFPVAGRVVVGDGGELSIACTGEGVAFVAAAANCSLADVKLFDPPFGSTLLKELAVGLGAEGFRPSDPLLLVQVTEFSCGGFVLAVTRNHAIADGTGFAQFLNAVGEIARGLPQPSVLPVSCGDGSLPALPPWVTAMEMVQLTLEPPDFAYLDITVASRCINRVKAGYTAGHADDPCTAFEAVVAVLWQCRTRAVMSDPETPAPLIFAASVRKQVGAKHGYYGNCVTSALAIPTSGEVANGSIVDVVNLIKRAKRRILQEFRKKDVADEEESVEPQLDVTFGYNAFDVTSWRNIGVDAVDFGGGRPARVMCSFDMMAVPYCVACPPCKEKDGVNVLARCVREEHVNAFLAEVAKFMCDGDVA